MSNFCLVGDKTTFHMGASHHLNYCWNALLCSILLLFNLVLTRVRTNSNPGSDRHPVWINVQ